LFAARSCPDTSNNEPGASGSKSRWACVFTAKKLERTKKKTTERTRGRYIVFKAEGGRRDSHRAFRLKLNSHAKSLASNQTEWCADDSQWRELKSRQC
jgi:hypothetical protein